MATEEHPRVKLRASMVTDVGVVRDHNEDSAYVDPGSHFFIVADGMGGHAAGEVASAMAVETVRDCLENASDKIEAFAAAPSDGARKELIAVLEQAVRSAHGAVYERGARETDKQGMGTTLDVLLVAGPEAFVAHVGDSRTYLLRDGKAAQITTDHTVAEVLVIEGKLSAEEAQVSPLRTILVNAIGVAPDVGVEMAHVALRAGDQLLLCSDGLHDYFPIDQELADHVVGLAPKRALTDVVELAKQRGGHDNITGVLVDVLEADEAGVGATGTDLDDTASMELVSNGVPQTVGRDDTLPTEANRKASAAQGKAAGGSKLRGRADGGARGSIERTEPYPAPGEDSSSAASEPAPGEDASSAASGPAPGEDSSSAASEPGSGEHASSAASGPASADAAGDSPSGSANDEEDDGPIEDDTLIGYPGAPVPPALGASKAAAASSGDDSAAADEQAGGERAIGTAPTVEMPTIEDAASSDTDEAAKADTATGADGDAAAGDTPDPSGGEDDHEAAAAASGSDDGGEGGDGGEHAHEDGESDGDQPSDDAGPVAGRGA